MANNSAVAFSLLLSIYLDEYQSQRRCLTSFVIKVVLTKLIAVLKLLFVHSYALKRIFVLELYVPVNTFSVMSG